jgi:hypothetical protein
MAKRKNDPPDDFDENTPPESFYGGDDDKGDNENNNDDDDEGDDDMSEFFDGDFSEDDEEIEREIRARDEEIENHPITRAAEEIYHLTEALIASLQPKPGMEDMHNEDSCSEIRSAAMMLGPKIAGAMAANEYTIALQNAAIIRDNAEYLRLCTNTLHHFYNVDKKHLRLHRSEIEKFRKLFIDWVKEIRNYEKLGDDEWGLFT